MNTNPPISCCTLPSGTAITAAKSMCPNTSTMYSTVSTAVTIVMASCIRMMRWKPNTPPPMTSSTTTMSVTILVGVPPSSPSSSNTVEVASTAREASTVSQPTVSSQAMTDGTRLPCTPNGARLSVSVGAEPRLPASEMNPQNRNDTKMPTIATTVACQNEIPKPSRNEP